MTIREIHNSLMNGQRRQMADQIDEYGLYDFWSEYKMFLLSTYVSKDAFVGYFTDAAISYHRIRSR